MLNVRLLRIALVAAVIGVTVANGWTLYRHRQRDAQAVQIISAQLREPANAQAAARLRDSLRILQRSDRGVLVRLGIIELFIVGVAAAIWLRLGRVLPIDDRG